MKRDSLVEQLRKLDEKAKKIRASLGFSNPNEVIFEADEDDWLGNEIVVVADGFGGAKVLVVKGNYPIDYSIKSERLYSSEDEACESAAKMAAGDLRTN